MKKTDKKQEKAVATKKQSPKKATEKKTSVKEQHSLATYKRATSEEAIVARKAFAEELVKTFYEASLSTKAERDKAVESLMDKFSDAVVAVSAATVVAMPPHWKRAWLTDICDGVVCVGVGKEAEAKKPAKKAAKK